MQDTAEDSEKGWTQEPFTVTADAEVMGSFWDHLEALCATLRFCFSCIAAGWLVCFIFSDWLLPLLYLPLSHLAEAPPLVLLSPLEGIKITSQLSFWVSCSVTAPVWGWRLLHFFLPALRQQERRLLLPFLLLSCVVLAASAYFAWAVTLPVANRFLSGWSAPLGTALWSLGAYMDYTLTLLLGHMVAGELCLLLGICVHTGWIAPTQLRRARRVMIVAILIVSALLTPPDIFTQLMMAIPLWMVYELAIVYAALREFQKRSCDFSIRASSSLLPEGVDAYKMDV